MPTDKNRAEKKRCPKCKKTKPRNEFCKDSTTKDKLHGWCKLCRQINKRAYYEINRTEILKKARKYYNLNCDQKRKEARRRRKAYLERIGKPARQKEIVRANKWKKNNPEKRKEIALKCFRKKRGDPTFRLNCQLKDGVYISLKTGNGKNGVSWKHLVDFTLEELKAHLEKLFQPGMTWENYGPTWHLDHRIPISAFNFTSPEHIDFKRCWCLENLQPLWAKENISKNNKLNKPLQPSLRV